MANLDAKYDIDHRADAIANHQDGTLVCLAGPGTGKTYSFLQRIRVLTTERGVAAEQICYLTFIKEITKAFSADYEEDQERAADDELTPRISTLHSLACRLIRGQGFRQGFDGPLYFMSVADSADPRSIVFLTDLLPLVQRGELRTVPRLRKQLEKTKEAWRDQVDPALLAAPLPDVLARYVHLSRAYRLIDWDQAIPFAHALFQSAGALPGWIARIEHLLVDEYQDFNRAEQALISSLATVVKSMVVVGDDDQSLYSRRGGAPDGLTELYRSDDVDQITLVRCHRCKSRILKAANTFLKAMRANPRPMLAKHKGGQVACRRFKSRKAEVAYLAGFLEECIAALPEQTRPKDGIACLFPTWKSLNSYLVLLRSEVPCYSRKPPFQAQRAWLKRVLELVCNPGQRFVERLLLEDFREIKPRHKREMIDLALERDLSPVEAMDVLVSTGKLSGIAATHAQGFCDLCWALSSRDPSLIAEKLAPWLGIDTPEFREQIEGFIQQLDVSDQEDAIGALCDTLVPESALPKEDARAVAFVTMHGSKGLTKRTVVMPGLEHAWLPGDVTGNDLDERRRLFYVALTRATDQVLITYPRTRPPKDPLNYPACGRKQASCFVSESGIHELVHR